MRPLVVALVLLSAAILAVSRAAAFALHDQPVPASSQTVTLVDNGGTVSLEVNQAFLLMLGDQYTWPVTVADQSIVSRVPNVLVVRGAQGIYAAHAPGRTDLYATGSPNCTAGQANCPGSNEQFHVRILVTPAATTPAATPTASTTATPVVATGTPTTATATTPAVPTAVPPASVTVVPSSASAAATAVTPAPPNTGTGVHPGTARWPLVDLGLGFVSLVGASLLFAWSRRSTPRH